MDLLLNTAALDRSAAAVDGASTFVALDGPDDFPQLTLGETMPVTAKFLSAANTYESWTADPTYTVTASLGYLTADGLQVFTEGTLSAIIANGKSGDLPLTTAALADAMRMAIMCNRRTSVGMVLQITVTDPDGDRRVFAQLLVMVNGRVPNFTPTPANTSSSNFITAAEVAATYLSKVDDRFFPTLIFFGQATDEQTFGYFYAEKACKILGMQIGAQVAPVGAAITVDLLNSSGVEQSKIGTLAAAGTFQRTAFATALDVAAGDYVRAKLKSVGSTTPGGYLTINLICRPNF